MVLTWLRNVTPLQRNDSRRAGRRFRPHLEVLEDRLTPAPLTVMTTLDTGAGSLQQAILDANSIPGDDTITVATGVTGTINLASPLSDLNLEGSGASQVTVQRSAAPGTPDFAISNVTSNATVTIAGLTIADGRASPGGGSPEAPTPAPTPAPPPTPARALTLRAILVTVTGDVEDDHFLGRGVDVAHQVRIRCSKVRLDRRTGKTRLRITIRNTSGRELSSLRLALGQLPPRAWVRVGDGKWMRAGQAGSLGASLGNHDELQPGETIALDVEIAGAGAVRPRLMPRVLSGPGSSDESNGTSGDPVVIATLLPAL